MTVGESLTQARYQAGLTIDELSERTKIRATVIRSIESDDYEACGGDLYVRGYVRAIAGAVGVDAQGLIRDYDQERVRASGDADATMFDLPAVAPPDPGSADGASGVSDAGRQDPDETRFDLPAGARGLGRDEVRHPGRARRSGRGPDGGRLRGAARGGRRRRRAGHARRERPPAGRRGDPGPRLGIWRCDRARPPSSAGRRRGRGGAGDSGRARRPPGVRVHDRQERGRLDGGAGQRVGQGGQVRLARHLGGGRHQARRVAHGHPVGRRPSPPRPSRRTSARR